jgi:hypothetical protein
VRRGYEYDASTLPTFIGPVARAYYLMTAKLDAAEREKRKALFGKFSDGLRPLKPYRWRVGTRLLTEIPVTTMPVFKMPIHVSYLLYLGAFSPRLALTYFRTALALCRLTGTQPSLLLHPLDFLCADDVSVLAFFPAMRQSLDGKLLLVSEALRMLDEQFEVLTLGQHARTVAQNCAVREVAEAAPESSLIRADDDREFAAKERA